MKLYESGGGQCVFLLFIFFYIAAPTPTLLHMLLPRCTCSHMAVRPAAPTPTSVNLLRKSNKKKLKRRIVPPPLFGTIL